MPSSRRKKKKRTSTPRVWRIIGSVALLVLIGGIGYSLFTTYHKRHDIEQQKAEFRDSIAKLQHENTNLEKTNKYLSTKGYRERKARKQGNLKAPGETAIKLSTSQSEDEFQTTQTNQDLVNKLRESDPYSEVLPDTNPERWWAYFFDRTRFPD